MKRYIRINIDDAMTEELMRLANEFPEFCQRALKSLGWMAQKEIKEGIRSGAPGGKAYPKKTPPARRRIIDRIFDRANEIKNRQSKRKERARYPILGGLKKAVGYDKRYIKEGTIIIGWLSPSAVSLGTKMEKGADQVITEKMRIALASDGIIVKKSHITIPARPTFKPMQSVITKKAVAYLTQKMHEYINNPNQRGKARSKRKYRVYT